MTTSQPTPVERKDVVDREREAFGGVKIVCAFFGWLTATGMSVLLVALVAAAGAGVGIVSSADDVVDATGADANDIGWAGVDLFFVLSGYLIGNQLLAPSARGESLELKTFFARRLLRTLPRRQ